MGAILTQITTLSMMVNIGFLFDWIQNQQRSMTADRSIKVFPGKIISWGKTFPQGCWHLLTDLRGSKRKFFAFGCLPALHAGKCIYSIAAAAAVIVQLFPSLSSSILHGPVAF